MFNILYALIITIVLEGALMLLLTRSFKWARYNLYCNLVTNPILNLCLMFIPYFAAKKIGFDATGIGPLSPEAPAVMTLSYNITFITGEIIVLITEGLLYRLLTKERYSRCFALSLFTNVFSMAAGLLFIYLGIW